MPCDERSSSGLFPLFYCGFVTTDKFSHNLDAFHLPNLSLLLACLLSTWQGSVALYQAGAQGCAVQLWLYSHPRDAAWDLQNAAKPLASSSQREAA